MVKRTLKLEGEAARGTVVSAQVLRDLLDAVIDGSRRAVRLRAQGSSSVRGPTPGWITASTNFDVEIGEGSTTLELSAPRLEEADPERFSQRELFSGLDPARPSVDYFFESVGAAMAAEGDDEKTSELYDRSFLHALRERLQPIFDHGIDSVSTEESPRHGSLVITAGVFSAFERLEQRIPDPQRVRLAGKLDTIAHSDRTLTLLVGDQSERVRGSLPEGLLNEAQQFWGHTVVVSGMAHFTSSARIQVIDVDLLHEASSRDTEFFGEVPAPLDVPELSSTSDLRIPQGPRSGLSAVIGSWPGDEDDEEVIAALEELS